MNRFFVIEPDSEHYERAPFLHACLVRFRTSISHCGRLTGKPEVGSATSFLALNFRNADYTSK